MAYSVTEAEFRAIAEAALDELPDEFSSRMENVVVVVEDYPSADYAAAAGVHRSELLGLFHGLTHFEHELGGGGVPNHLPERIVLYRRNIEAICSTREELTREIRQTVLHEIGHFFGLTEEDLRKYESD